MSATNIDRVNEALQEVVDPCSLARGVPAGLRDMGMVTGVQLSSTPDGRALATVELRTTSPACTFVPYFEQRVRESLATVAEIDEVRIEWNGAFEWSDDDMSQALKQRLREKREHLLAMANSTRGCDER